MIVIFFGEKGWSPTLPARGVFGIAIDAEETAADEDAGGLASFESFLLQAPQAVASRPNKEDARAIRAEVCIARA
jgi:hypothetical protein